VPGGLAVLLPHVPPEAQRAADRLAQAGHRVLTCHEPGEEAFPCSALRGRPCPLDGGVDVAVVARPRGGIQPTPFEDGAVCAARRRVPLVVAGQTSPNPFAAWTAATASLESIPEAVAAAATAVSPGHSAVATAAWRAALAARGTPAAGTVEVRRERGRLKARIRSLGLPAGDAEAGAVAVLGALRAFDPGASGVDVAAR
jgi:hypothetical protein